jgi:hypothetical protein
MWLWTFRFQSSYFSCLISYLYLQFDKILCRSVIKIILVFSGFSFHHYFIFGILSLKCFFFVLFGVFQLDLFNVSRSWLPVDCHLLYQKLHNCHKIKLQLVLPSNFCLSNCTTLHLCAALYECQTMIEARDILVAHLILLPLCFY